MNADILSNISLGSVTSNTNGSSIDTFRISRTTIFSTVLTNTSGATLNIQTSPDNSEWFTIDIKTFDSGTSIQTYAKRFESFLPFTRVASSNIAGTVDISSTITGRGV